jgi:hypothetical protein
MRGQLTEPELSDLEPLEMLAQLGIGKIKTQLSAILQGECWVMILKVSLDLMLFQASSILHLQSS